MPEPAGIVSGEFPMEQSLQISVISLWINDAFPSELSHVSRVNQSLSVVPWLGRNKRAAKKQQYVDIYKCTQ